MENADLHHRVLREGQWHEHTETVVVVEWSTGNGEVELVLNKWFGVLDTRERFMHDYYAGLGCLRYWIGMLDGAHPWCHLIACGCHGSMNLDETESEWMYAGSRVAQSVELAYNLVTMGEVHVV